MVGYWETYSVHLKADNWADRSGSNLAVQKEMPMAGHWAELMAEWWVETRAAVTVGLWAAQMVRQWAGKSVVYSEKQMAVRME